MEGGSPDWVRGGLVQFRDELLLFVRTLWGFTRHPRRFTRGWLRGEIHALNPFGYLLTAIGVVGAAQIVYVAISKKAVEEGSLLKQLLGSVLPPAYFLALGLTTHLLLRVLGSRGPRLRDTAAIALYASGPSYLGYAALLLCAGFLRDERTNSLRALLVVVPLALGSLTLFSVTFVAALRELHDVPRRPWMRSISAFGAVFVLSGFFFGGVHPPGNFGLHPTIWPPSHASHDHWVANFGD